MKLSYLSCSLVIVLLLVPHTTADSTQFMDQTVVFDEFDIDQPWNNVTEEVIVWTNSTPMFSDGQDQVTLNYTLLTSDHPVEVVVNFLTKDVFDSGASWLTSSFTVGNIKEGSTFSITINWKSLLDETVLDETNYDPSYTVLRQYQITTQLVTTTPLWQQESRSDITASYSEHIRDLGSSNYSLDLSETIFTTNSTSTSEISSTGTDLESTTPTSPAVSSSTTDDAPLPLALLPISLALVVILRRCNL